MSDLPKIVVSGGQDLLWAIPFYFPVIFWIFTFVLLFALKVTCDLVWFSSLFICIIAVLFRWIFDFNWARVWQVFSQPVPMLPEHCPLELTAWRSPWGRRSLARYCSPCWPRGAPAIAIGSGVWVSCCSIRSLPPCKAKISAANSLFSCVKASSSCSFCWNTSYFCKLSFSRCVSSTSFSSFSDISEWVATFCHDQF